MPDQIFKKNEYKFILVALLLFLGFIIFKQMRPYFGGFLGAFTLYVILRGQMKFLVEKKRWGRGISATLILIESLLLFLLPLTGIGILVVDTLSDIDINLEIIKTTALRFFTNINDRFGFDIKNLDFLSFLPKLGTNLVQVLATNSYSFVINLFVIVFVLYFMLYGYKDFENMVRDMLPFTAQNKVIFVNEARSIIQANAIGIPLLALIQGGFAYIGYLIFGTASPMLYAILTAFATILPLVGTAIVYIPLALVFLLDAKYGAAIGLTLYGIVVIGSVDNVARFILQKKLANIHPLITVFGVLIGLPMFGFWGIIFGPLILSLFMLIVNMYRHDYIADSNAQPSISTDVKPANYERIQKVKLPKPQKEKKEQEPESESDDV
ncbi:MAG: AI-2E family transporter [Paludibacteraceae bacterium]